VRDLDDVVQESYLRILRARPEGRIASGRAFLFRVARNLALNLLRRNRVSPVEAVPDLARLPVADVGPNAADFACNQESLRLLAEAIDALPPRCREIVILRRIRNLPQREIAAQLGISVETVEQQVARGVRRCADYMLRRNPARRP
jgi:RNA polymerase sigma-70 factor (ECF subfamily)